MFSFLRTGARRTRIGQPPGSMIYVGEESTAAVTASVFHYSSNQVEENGDADIDECCVDQEGQVTWININGLRDAKLITRVMDRHDIHPLTRDDILNTRHRPKAEDLDGYQFITLKMLSVDNNEVKLEQVSFVLKPGLLISFQERPGDVFEPIRTRLREKKGRVRDEAADYLLYCLLDAVIDNYYLVLEHIGEELELLDQEIMQEADPKLLRRIHDQKMDLFGLRKAVWPLREVIDHLQESDNPFVSEACRPFYQDLYDHTVQVIDTLQTFRDVAAGIMDLYMSTVSNRMNEIMQVLTIMATIFIPLTFVAGIYGMNFDYMPELKWKGAYFGVWGLMLAIAATMLVYFRRKKWL